MMMMMWCRGVGCLLMEELIIDDDFDHSLSSLKKNRKATFDVSYRGVLYSAFFVSLYVSMMESRGSEFEFQDLFIYLMSVLRSFHSLYEPMMEWRGGSILYPPQK